MEGMRMTLLCVMVAILITAVNGESLHYVGGTRQGWAPNVNLTDWSINQQFNVSDWLYFGFDKTLHNVLEVNKTGYETCSDIDFIKNITRGGRDVYQLREPKTYYFICGKGYCFAGMKVAVNVVVNTRPSSSPIPTPKENAASSIYFSGMITMTSIFLASSLGLAVL